MKKQILLFVFLLLSDFGVFVLDVDPAAASSGDGGCGPGEKAVCLKATNETVCPAEPVANYLIAVGAAYDGCCTPPDDDGGSEEPKSDSDGNQVQEVSMERCPNGCIWATLHAVPSAPGDCHGVFVFYASSGTEGTPVLNVGGNQISVQFSHPAIEKELAMVESLGISSSVPLQVGYVNVDAFGSDLGLVRLDFANKVSNQLNVTDINTCP